MAAARGAARALRSSLHGSGARFAHGGSSVGGPVAGAPATPAEARAALEYCVSHVRCAMMRPARAAHPVYTRPAAR
jgi:hypothetical protein